MIKEVKMFTVICDNCGLSSGEEYDSEYSAWGDKNSALEDAINGDWIEEGHKHYCPNCFSYDDNDNLILKKIVK